MKAILFTDDDLDGVSCSIVLDSFGVTHEAIITNCFNFTDSVDIEYLKKEKITDVFITDIMLNNSHVGVLNSLREFFNVHYIDHHESSLIFKDNPNTKVDTSLDTCGCYLLYEYLVENRFRLLSKYNKRNVIDYCEMVTSQDNNIWVEDDYRIPWFINVIFKKLGPNEFFNNVVSEKFNYMKVIKNNRVLLDRENNQLLNLLEKKSKEALKFSFNGYSCSFMIISTMLKEVSSLYLVNNKKIDMLFVLFNSSLIIFTRKDNIDLYSMFSKSVNCTGNRNKIVVEIGADGLLKMIMSNYIIN